MRPEPGVTMPWRSESASFPKATSKRSLSATRFAMAQGEEQSVRILPRSEEHTSELQSREKLVCRRLLEKKHQDDAARDRRGRRSADRRDRRVRSGLVPC